MIHMAHLLGVSYESNCPSCFFFLCIHDMFGTLNIVRGYEFTTEYFYMSRTMISIKPLTLESVWAVWICCLLCLHVSAKATRHPANMYSHFLAPAAWTARYIRKSLGSFQLIVDSLAREYAPFLLVLAVWIASSYI